MKNRYLKNVVTLEHFEDKCTNCGMCMAVCPHAVFAETEGRVHIADRDSCMECGACMANCAFNAIKVQKGVGCAAAIIQGMLKGTEPSCGGGCCGE